MTNRKGKQHVEAAGVEDQISKYQRQREDVGRQVKLRYLKCVVAEFRNAGANKYVYAALAMFGCGLGCW